MVTAGAGIELATTTAQAAITAVGGNGDVDSTINAIITALENVGILIPN